MSRVLKEVSLDGIKDLFLLEQLLLTAPVVVIELRMSRIREIVMQLFT